MNAVPAMLLIFDAVTIVFGGFTGVGTIGAGALDWHTAATTMLRFERVL